MNLRRRTLAHLADTAVLHYRAMCELDGIDPDVELATVRFGAGIEVASWMAYRLAAGPGVDPTDTSAVIELAGNSPWNIHVRALAAVDHPGYLATWAACDTRVERAITRAALRDPDPAIRLQVARSLDAPARIMARLARDPDPAVRAAVAGNIGNVHVRARTHRRLATDPDDTVRTALARNKRTPANALQQLAHDPTRTVRAGVTTNPHTPDHTRAALIDDLHPDTAAHIRARICRQPPPPGTRTGS